MNIYLELTERFNQGKLRAIISSGQAVVLHRLAIMSKDGDWILKEDNETMKHVLGILSEFNARYRFGAPLDKRWMTGGWSSHFEFRHEQLRVRTDFVTRPPRIQRSELEMIWDEQAGHGTPFVGARHLAEIKKTNREKDYAIIGELARIMVDPADQLLYSRSARDLIGLAEEYPDLVQDLKSKRRVLQFIRKGRERLEETIDAERRMLMRANEDRLAAYAEAAQAWSSVWLDVRNEITGRSLLEAHEIIVRKAELFLPFQLSRGVSSDQVPR